MSQIYNLTPHSIHKYIGSQLVLSIPAIGLVARCAEIRKSLGILFEWEIETPEFGEVSLAEVDASAKVIPGTERPFPTPAEGEGYIVSFPVASALWKQGRTDVFTVSSPVREAEILPQDQWTDPRGGRIVGCRKLGGNPIM